MPPTPLRSDPDGASLTRVAELIAQRNAIDAEIAEITGRPPVSGHLGEWIASQIFDIELENSAANPAIDGRFRSGPLDGRTVNVKWYGKREGLLDLTDDPGLDYYLVLTGPKGAAGSSRGVARPLALEAVYLFDARALVRSLSERGIKLGVAASVRSEHWHEAEIHPSANNPVLKLTQAQREDLGRF